MQSGTFLKAANCYSYKLYMSKSWSGNLKCRLVVIPASLKWIIVRKSDDSTCSTILRYEFVISLRRLSCNLVISLWNYQWKIKYPKITIAIIHHKCGYTLDVLLFGQYKCGHFLQLKCQSNWNRLIGNLLCRWIYFFVSIKSRFVDFFLADKSYNLSRHIAQARFERSFITINSYHIRQSLAKCNGVELNVDFIRFFIVFKQSFWYKMW